MTEWNRGPVPVGGGECNGTGPRNSRAARGRVAAGPNQWSTLRLMINLAGDYRPG
jgi:hypothetical protein